jgi:hypothetical protein
MYQSSYIDDGSKKPFKHSNSALGDSQSRLPGAASVKSVAASQVNMKTSNYNDMPLSQYYDNILSIRAKDREKGSNAMYRSQSLSKSQQNERAEANKEMKNFALPQEIMKFLDEEPSKLAEVEFLMQQEEAEVDQILDNLLEDITKIIEDKKMSVKKVFAEFLDSYSKARDLFQRRINDFKDTSKFFGAYKVGGSADRLMSLDSIEYFDQNGKIKEEFCNLRCKLGSLNKEIEKKYLAFFAQNLEKEICHRPALSLTETSKEYLIDMSKIIKEKLTSNLEILDSLVYKVDPFRFEDLTVKPVVKPSLGESKSNIIANIGNLLGPEASFKVEYIESHYEEKINCLCVIEEDLVATGHADNSVGVWSMTKGCQVATLKGHTSPVSALVSIKAYFPEINLAKDAKVESGYIRNRNIKQQNFLISASEGPDAELLLWDLQAMKLIRKFEPHKDTVTSLISLRDGHTVISGSLDSTVKCWDISLETPLQTIVEGEDCPTYYIHIFNDFSHFLTAGKSGDLFIYKMNYGLNPRYDRTVFENCKRIKVIKTGLPVFVINESMVKDSTVISAGADKRIAFWNTVTCAEQKKLGNHQTDIVGCVLIENPLNAKANSYCLSSGTYDDRIQITDINTGESKEMALDTDISLTGGKYSNPNFQFMPVTDVFGKSKVYLLCAGSKHGMPCLVKIRIDSQAENST